MTAPQQDIQTEFPFSLPRGFVDRDGTIHRDGTMRLATAFDEIAPLRDPRVQSNPGYLVLILLARVVQRLGTLEHITAKTIEGLYSRDLLYLQSFYQQINELGDSRMMVTCPHCAGDFVVEPPGPGGA